MMEGLGIIVLLLVGFVSGGWVFHDMSDEKWQTELIKRGLARYNPKTGEWEWIEDSADTKGMSKT